MLHIIPDTENLSTKPSSPNHSIPGEPPCKDSFHFQDYCEHVANINAKFEIE